MNNCEHWIPIHTVDNEHFNQISVYALTVEHAKQKFSEYTPDYVKVIIDLILEGNHVFFVYLDDYKISVVVHDSKTFSDHLSTMLLEHFKSPEVYKTYLGQNLMRGLWNLEIQLKPYPIETTLSPIS